MPGGLLPATNAIKVQFLQETSVYAFANQALVTVVLPDRNLFAASFLESFLLFFSYKAKNIRAQMHGILFRIKGVMTAETCIEQGSNL